MNYFVNEKSINASSGKVASGKARQDINNILKKIGYTPINIHVAGDTDASREKMTFLKKMQSHYKVYKAWKRAIAPFKAGDRIVLQYPVINHTLLMEKISKKLKNKNVKLILIIHDLSVLRFNLDKKSKIRSYRIRFEENTMLKIADYIISHNDIMSEYIYNSNYKGEIIPLTVFDYLIDKGVLDEIPIRRKESPIIIAGNLAKEKAGYAYALPGNYCFNLYGIKYTGEENDMISYKGSFDADKLPYHLEGGFGLVWDGPDIDGCSGEYGNYLKYNNPHKVSLYLACGIPVIIWSKAAMSKFIKDNKVGIVIDSLSDIHNKLSSISAEEYNDMLKNTKIISARLRDGYYTKEALKKVDSK